MGRDTFAVALFLLLAIFGQSLSQYSFDYGTGLVGGVNYFSSSPSPAPDTLPYYPQVETVVNAPSDTNTVLGKLLQRGGYTNFINWIVSAGLVDSFSAPGITVFVPLPSSLTDFSLGDPKNLPSLTQLLKYHIVPGVYTSRDLTNGQTLKTLQGQSLVYSSTPFPSINGVGLATVDLQASNGVIHFVGTPLRPKTLVDVLAADGRFNTLVSLLRSNGLSAAFDVNQKYTVFAPTDAAFARVLPALGTLTPKQVVGTLLYHVLAGVTPYTSFRNGTQLPTLHQGQLLDITVTNCKTVINGYVAITQPDLNAANGLVHVVDRVILLKNVLQVASDFGHTTFVAAVRALNGYCNFSVTTPELRTVFVPTNDAFAALPAGVLTSLLQPQNVKQLVDILRYHVVPGSHAYTSELYVFETLKTALNNSLLTVNLNVSGYFVNEALILTADLVTGSGVVQVIDTVLLPRSVVQILSGSYKFNTLLSLFSLANFSFPTTPFTLFAPSDDAFASLSPALVNSVVSNQALLRTVLNYHVVPNLVSTSCSWKDFLQFPTLGSNNTLTLVLPNTINTATITLADHIATNGVVHFINSILLPPQ